MAWKRKVSGGILAVIGYILSPLSWWNDMFVNVPLALVFAWLVSLFYRPAFEASVIVGYWLTNVIGLVLMHKGAEKVLSEKDRAYSRRDLLRDVGISMLYTLLIVMLLKLKILQPIGNYFKNP
jgi:multisubunit Na+/H+ antiporter MnhG subunit